MSDGEDAVAIRRFEATAEALRELDSTPRPRYSEVASSNFIGLRNVLMRRFRAVSLNLLRGFAREELQALNDAVLATPIDLEVAGALCCCKD